MKGLQTIETEQKQCGVCKLGSVSLCIALKGALVIGFLSLSLFSLCFLCLYMKTNNNNKINTMTTRPYNFVLKRSMPMHYLSDCCKEQILDHVCCLVKHVVRASKHLCIPLEVAIMKPIQVG